jgi:hypothetical protein
VAPRPVDLDGIDFRYEKDDRLDQVAIQRASSSTCSLGRRSCNIRSYEHSSAGPKYCGRSRDAGGVSQRGCGKVKPDRTWLDTQQIPEDQKRLISANFMSTIRSPLSSRFENSLEKVELMTSIHGMRGEHFQHNDA